MGLHLSKVPKLFDLTRYETKTKETTKLAGVSKKGFPFLEASLNQYSVKIIIFAVGVCLEKRGYSSWEIFWIRTRDDANCIAYCQGDYFLHTRNSHDCHKLVLSWSNASDQQYWRKRLRAYKGPQHTPDAIWQKFVLFPENICLFLKIAINVLLQRYVET